MTAPLQIVVLHDPTSEQAARLGDLVLSRFMVGAGTAGLRIPVAFGPDLGEVSPPDDIDLTAAQKTVAVILADSRMLNANFGGPAAEWAEFLANLLSRREAGKFAVVPFALDNGVFEVLGPALEPYNFVPLPAGDDDARGEELVFQIGVYALKTLEGDAADGRQQSAPLTVFLSHAKADLPEEGATGAGPVGAILEYLSTRPVSHWFDSQDIEASRKFEKAIVSGLASSTAMIAVLTDSYPDRPWCRREMLIAKGFRLSDEPDAAAAVPLVVIDALEEGVARDFPYGGNHRSVHWAGDEKTAARRAVNTAIGEALRFKCNRLRLLDRAGPHEAALGAPPELLSLALLPKETRRVWYPDPPLGREELAVLVRQRPEIEFTTPQTELAKRMPDNSGKFVALSLSGSPDIRRYGARPEHLKLFADDLSTLLLASGIGLAYGGMIGHEGSGDDTVDYMDLLLEKIHSHARTHDLKERMVVNYVGWPIYHRLKDEDIARYGAWAELARIPVPDLPEVTRTALQDCMDSWFLGDTADRRFAWARSMTALRDHMIADERIAARVVVGGKLQNYLSRYAGVLEEALLTLRAKKPLFLLGAFGGAASLVIDVMEGCPRKELTTAWAEENLPHFNELRAVHSSAGVEMKTPEELAEELAAFSIVDLHNGLDEELNRELFSSTHPERMVDLVLRGLLGKVGSG